MNSLGIIVLEVEALENAFFPHITFAAQHPQSHPHLTSSATLLDPNCPPQHQLPSSQTMSTLPTFIPTYLQTNLPTFQPTYLPSQQKYQIHQQSHPHLASSFLCHLWLYLPISTTKSTASNHVLLLNHIPITNPHPISIAWTQNLQLISKECGVFTNNFTTTKTLNVQTN